jgi:hypothetical protein
MTWQELVCDWLDTLAQERQLLVVELLEEFTAWIRSTRKEDPTCTSQSW